MITAFIMPKQCNSCNQTKSRTEFTKKSTVCKECKISSTQLLTDDVSTIDGSISDISRMDDVYARLDMFQQSLDINTQNISSKITLVEKKMDEISKRLSTVEQLAAVTDALHTKLDVIHTKLDNTLMRMDVLEDISKRLTSANAMHNLAVKFMEKSFVNSQP